MCLLCYLCCSDSLYTNIIFTPIFHFCGFCFCFLNFLISFLQIFVVQLFIIMDFWLQFVWDIVELILVTIYSFYTVLESIYRFYIPKEKKLLKNETILITGSGRGIGRELSLQLARLGATVICWSRTAGPNDILVQEIKSEGGRAFSYSVDVGDRNAVAKAAEKVKKEIGNPTMIINNAGILEVKPFLQTTDKELEAIYQTNVFSNFWVLKEFLQDMIDKGTGHIVSICSASGILSTGYIVGYCSSKHAVHGYMESLKDEMRNHPSSPDIKFTIAYPFFTHTDMIADIDTNTRFPFLIPKIEVEDVAEIIIDGIQREKEYIYIPGFIKHLAIWNWLIPKKASEAFADFLQVYIRPNPKT